MKIAHRPYLNTDNVIDLYSKKDGVQISYVCTSALGNESMAMDIFYRETPHPEFGNHYFGLYSVSTGSLDEQRQLRIINADKIEDAEFGMAEVDGELHYSQHRHDFYTVGNVSLDGGRAYFRRVGDMSIPTQWLKVKDGVFVNEDDV
jgi:hypothetical protein